MASKKRRKKAKKTRVTELGKAVSQAAYTAGRARRKAAEEEERTWENDEVLVE